MFGFSKDENQGESRIMGEEYLEMLEELSQLGSNVSANYSSLDLPNGKLDHAKENLGVITGSAQSVHITEKGLNYLMWHRLDRNIERQNKLVDELDSSINSLKKSMSQFNVVSIYFTMALIMFGIAQLSVSTGLLSQRVTIISVIFGVFLMVLGGFSLAYMHSNIGIKEKFIQEIAGE